MRLAIIRTHPTQYFSPLYRFLASTAGIDLKVFYILKNRGQGEFDPDFNQTVSWDVSLLDGYDYEFVQPRPLPFQPKHVFESRAPELNEKLVRGKFDAVFCAGYSLWLDWQVMAFSISNKIPLIIRPEMTESHSLRSGIKTQLRTQFLKWYFHQVSAYLYIGAKSLEIYLKHGGDREKSFFSPYAVDNSFFMNHPIARTSKDILKKQIGFESCDLTLLYVGKLIPKKGLDLLLKAIKPLCDKINLGLLVVGDGPEKENYLNQIKRLNLKHFYFAGFQNQSQLPYYYRTGDVLILPSRREPWGLVVNEAMASGLPAIVSDRVGASYDLIEKGKTGYVFQAESESSLFNSLNLFYHDYKQGKFSSDIIQRRVESNSIKKAAQGFLDAMEFVKRK